MSKLREILQAMEELNKRQPQPFSHIIQKYCAHQEQHYCLLGMQCIGYMHAKLQVISCYEDNAIIWLIHNDKPNPDTKLSVSWHYITPQIFDALRELDAAQNIDIIWSAFEDFVQSMCTMSWPSDGDCNDYYNDDYKILERIEWEIDNP